MALSIKIIHGFAATNLIIFGLAACSSTPAPWTQTDDSPWGAKHEAEAQNTLSDEAASDTSLNDPVLLADPDPALEAETIVMEEPEMAPAPEMIAPVVVEEEPAGQNIMAMLSSNYAVQVYAGKTNESVEKFKNRKDLTDLTTVKTDRSGSIFYVLVDIYPDRASANAAAADLEAKTGSKPWVRSLAGLQKIAVE
jgi:septal ring-binding cell division protein DamX